MFYKSKILVFAFCAMITLDFSLSFPSNYEQNLVDSVFSDGNVNEGSNITTSQVVAAVLSTKVDSINSILPYLNHFEKTVVVIDAQVEENKIKKLLTDFKQELLSEVKEIVSKSCTSTTESNKAVTVESIIGSGRNCLIRNRRFPEYYYPAEGFDRDSERRRAFTWVPGSYDNQCLWNLERYQSGNDIKYKIKSVKHGEYLYAGANDLKYDTNRREVFTWKPKTQCEEQCYWDIQLVQDSDTVQTYFTIRNTEYGEYFYAMDGDLYDQNRRRTFTWKFDPKHDVQRDTQSHWFIKCD